MSSVNYSSSNIATLFRPIGRVETLKKSSYIKDIPIKVIVSEDNNQFSVNNKINNNNNNLISNKTFIISKNNNNNNFISLSSNSTLNTSSFEENFNYPFSILKSRKKEKKFLRKKFNTISSRVHNMDCLLKKIKAKFLKYVYIIIKKNIKKIKIRKFDQSKEVRNLNVIHNRDNFINLKVIDVLFKNNIINKKDFEENKNYLDKEFIDILNLKIKFFYQFHFLSSNYFKMWLKDPIKINNNNNKTNIKFPNHSKNIFKENNENYIKYKLLLLHTATNFIFYFQNNPLKFGKKTNNNNYLINDNENNDVENDLSEISYYS